MFTYDLEVEYSNPSGVQWLVAPGQPISIDPNGVPTMNTTATITVQGAPNDTVSSYPVLIQTVQDATQICPTDDASWIVRVHPVPDAEIAPDVPNGCNPVDVNYTLTFNNKIDGANCTYAWDLGQGDVSDIQNPYKQFTVDGANPVSVVVTSDQGCDTTITGNIDVYPIPVALFTPDPNNFSTVALPKFKFNEESLMDDAGLSSTITDYAWDFGEILIDTDTSTERHPTYWYEGDTGVYDVTLTVESNYGCVSTVTRPVVLGPDITVFIPNAFTPDGAGPEGNDDFHVIVLGQKSFELIIFNRWGQTMFETTDKEIGWDGTNNGIDCQQDVYAYTLKVTSLNDDTYEYNGTITLIR
jgi:gliding motility-associated-like protein